MNVTLTPRFNPMTVRVEHNPKLVAMDDMLLENNLVLALDKGDFATANEYEQEIHVRGAGN